MINGFLTIGVLQLFGVMLPGPDFAMVVKNTLQHSRRAGLQTAAGIATGMLFHMTYCLLGLAIIISQSLVLFNAVKYLGGVYLIYIGVKTFLSKNIISSHVYHHAKKPLGAWRAFQQGFLCNVLNPKATLFFLGIFTLVIKPGTPFTIQLIYAIEIILIAWLWFSFLAVLLTHPRIEKKLHAMQAVIGKLLGAFLVAFGTKLILLTHR